jgi:hypothetical protein
MICHVGGGDEVRCESLCAESLIFLLAPRQDKIAGS